ADPADRLRWAGDDAGPPTVELAPVAPAVDPQPEASPAPVFVDASGRRQRRIRRLGVVLAVPAGGYLALLVSTLLGGPTVNAPFLPLPQAPAPSAPASADTPSGTPSAGPEAAAPGAPATAAPTHQRTVVPVSVQHPSATGVTVPTGPGRGPGTPNAPAATSTPAPATTPAAAPSTAPAATPTPGHGRPTAPPGNPTGRPGKP
ncbi:hypothetical protein, partial [Kitasatospora sp. NPDC058190]|uniref:hypothetical protein n=1 Tax=Kitasatospora sp. NPDC058190 TaxID=3346371 RepID=UPI0036D9C718